MERLTEQQGLNVHTKFRGDYGSQNILHRLAEYEKTDLEPEQIKSLNKGRILLVTQIEDDEKIINDLTRAICTKDEEIKKLKSQLANTNGGKINERNYV